MPLHAFLQQMPSPSREQAQAFLEILQQRLSPLDWTRLQTHLEQMPPARRQGLIEFIAQRESHAPAVGTMAPDFTLPRLGSMEHVQLAAYRQHMPVALIFGSFT